MTDIEKPLIQENARELIKLSIVSTGTYLSSRLFLRLVKNPMILFGTGLVVGFYVHKNRKQITETLIEAKVQCAQLLGKNDQMPNKTDDA